MDKVTLITGTIIILVFVGMLSITLNATRDFNERKELFQQSCERMNGTYDYQMENAFKEERHWCLLHDRCEMWKDKDGNIQGRCP